MLSVAALVGLAGYWVAHGGLGGRLIEIDGRYWEDLARKIIIDLRNRYVLYYSPLDKTRDGRYHNIHVQVIPPRGLGKLTAHWRTGYYAPAE